MRVLVCGGRNYEDMFVVVHELDKLDISLLIHGGAAGADAMADLYAHNRNIPVQVYPANWDKYGRSAGPIRNTLMLREGKPDLVVAFPGGKGTANMIKQALEARVKVILL